jgi:pimeloyl-ACP methyl ester carboxylesterase
VSERGAAGDSHTVRRVRTWLRRIWVTAGLGFVAWLAWNAQASGVSATVLAPSATVDVLDTGGILQFRPRAMAPNTPGLIFLPGAMVEPAAYAPLLRAVAEAGYPAILVPLPWRAAPSASNRAAVWGRISAVMDGSRPWVLSGHSRGAALTARFAGEHAADSGATLAGIVLIGTTHPKASSLAGLAIPVTKIYGTQDCVAGSAAVLANVRLLPPHARLVKLEGANHSQFGWYGRQLGDCEATMSRQEQQARTLDAVLAALAALRAPA